MNISELIQSFLHKDKSFFDDIYKQYAQKVFRTSYIITGNYDVAEDITQEVFSNIYLNIKNLKSFNSLSGWINKITINSCINYIRKEKKLLFISDELNMDKVEDLNTPIAETLILQKELHNMVISTINELPDHQRIPIILYYYADMSYEEIATAMNCSEGTIKSRLFNAKKKLKQKIIQLQYFEEGDKCNEH